MRSLTVFLPLPPGINASYANAAGKGRVCTKVLKAWKKTAAGEILSRAHGVKMLGTFKISIIASDVDLSHARDADGICKAICDAFVQNHIVPDDNHRHMRSVCVEWSGDVPAGFAAVTLTELTQEPPQAPVSKYAPKTRGKPTPSVEASMALLRAIGINVASHRIHFQ